MAIDKFSAWLERSRGVSYDPYDVLGTRYGRWARRLYYRKNPFGVPANAPLILMEILYPGLRGLFVRKTRYPTADAQLALAFLNLHEASQLPAGARLGGARSVWLDNAKQLADGLLAQTVPGYQGLGWGYPFDWQHVNGLMSKNTPHITATPYCYEVFTRLFDMTGEGRYLDVARAITSFVFNDLKDTPTGPDAAAASYTPHDRGKVVNASAYRAFVLFDAARRFGGFALQEKAWKNLRFILQAQQHDGSWLYAIDNPAEAFIDHFHTCFVLKNLYKINQELRSLQVWRALESGYRYYRTALFDAEDNPKLYSVAPRMQLVRLEMYSVAEAISLGVLLRNEIPEAFALAEKLAERGMICYQLPAGYFVTRVYLGGIRHTVPYLRWPQSQLFFALTSLLLALEPGSNHVE
jgi:hypothetical protein